MLSLLSNPSMSGGVVDVGAVGSIGASVDSATSTSIAGSFSGVADGSGAVGAVGSGAGSAAGSGSGLAGSWAIASVLNLASIATWNVPTCDGSTWCNIIRAVSTCASAD